MELRNPAIACLALLLGACAIPGAPVPESVRTERVQEKSYVIGRDGTARPGDAVIRVKDYVQRITEHAFMSPVAKFRVGLGKRGDIDLTPEDNCRIAGSMELNKRMYTVVLLPERAREPEEVGLLVGHDGTLSGAAYSRTRSGPWTRLLHDAVLTPEQAKMSPAQSKDVDPEARYENFELLYEGSDGKSVFLVYREYPRNDLARPALAQKLSLEIQAGAIGFRGYKLKVLSAGPQGLSYQVIQDGS